MDMFAELAPQMRSGKMSKRQALRDLVTERLVAAADEVFALIEQAFAEYEEEIQKLVKLQEQSDAQHKEGFRAPFDPENTADEQTLCDSFDFQFPSLKLEDDADKPSFLPGDKAGQCRAEEPGCSLLPFQNPDADDAPAWPSAAQRPALGKDHTSEAEHEDALSLKRRKPQKRQCDLNESGAPIKKESEEPLEACTPSAPISGSAEKTFPFSLCGSKSTGARARRKPAKCPECGVTLHREFSLERHIAAVHRRERPYGCPVCGRAFAQKTDCVIHMRTHTGEKPYACPVCQRGFGIKKSLQRHMKLHGL